MGRPSNTIIPAEVVILSCAFRWSSPPNRIAQQFHGLRFRTVPCRGSARRRRRVDAPTEIANGLGRRRLCQEFGNRLAKFAIGYGRDRRAQRAVAGTSLRMRTSSAQKGNSISSRVWLWRSASSAVTGVKKRKPRQRPKTRRGLRAFTSFPRLPHLKSITPMSRLGSTRVGLDCSLREVPPRGGRISATIAKFSR